MSPEELEEIRRRAESTRRWINKGQPVSRAERDRAALLAEVDALWELAYNLPGGPEALRETERR